MDKGGRDWVTGYGGRMGVIHSSSTAAVFDEPIYLSNAIVFTIILPRLPGRRARVGVDCWCICIVVLSSGPEHGKTPSSTHGGKMGCKPRPRRKVVYPIRVEAAVYRVCAYRKSTSKV